MKRSTPTEGEKIVMDVLRYAAALARADPANVGRILSGELRVQLLDRQVKAVLREKPALASSSAPGKLWIGGMSVDALPDSARN